MSSKDSPAFSRRVFLTGAASMGLASLSGCGERGCSCTATVDVATSTGGTPELRGALSSEARAGGRGGRLYPLRRPPNSARLLQSAAGAPIFLLGDTAWSLAVSASRTDVIRYLDNRRAGRFNAFTFNAIEHEFAGGHGNRAPCNWYGQPPFRNTRDFTTPCESYWENIDFIVRQAAARDMLCIIFPAYEGYGGGSQGWYREMASQGAEKLQRYGAWLANRYFAYDNILWVAGGDHDPPDRSLTRAVVAGIRSRTRKWLFGWHGARNTDALAFWAGDLGWLDLNTIYDSANRAAANAEAAYSSPVFKPFARIEDTYENPVVGRVSPAFIRWLAWDSVLQGGTGAIYGDVAVWRFSGPGVVADPTNWVAALERPAGASMKHLRALFESLAWPRLVPDYTTRVWMTEGWSRACLAALADDCGFGVVYAPDASKGLTLDLGRMTGPAVSAHWYDPTSGALIAQGTYPTRGSRAFARSRANAGGQSDWALLVESRGEAARPSASFRRSLDRRDALASRSSKL